MLVGLDGSEGSARALSCARELRDRLGATLRAVAAREDGQVDLRSASQAAAEQGLELEEIAGPVVDSLISVGERVAHRSRSSVLVVRADDAGAHPTR
jgi:nucleotide-binding universal stress UspA family protein